MEWNSEADKKFEIAPLIRMLMIAPPDLITEIFFSQTKSQHEIITPMKNLVDYFMGKNFRRKRLSRIPSTLTDIDDPCVHVDIEKLASYKINHLKQWLIYPGDKLRGIETLKNAQVRVLDYF